MSNGVTSALIRVNRASEHLKQLDIACGAFYKTNPYTIDSKSNIETCERTYYLVRMDAVPDDPIAAIVGDILNNVRSALDYVAHELVAVALKSPGPYTRVQFPIAETSEQFDSELTRRIDCLGKEAKDAIRGLKPYKTGNELLWALHELNRRDKHRLLLTIGTGYSAHSMPPTQTAQAIGAPSHAMPYLGCIFAELPNIRLLKAGDELLTIPESEVHENMQFRFHIALNEVDCLRGKPLMETMYNMIMMTTDIVIKFSLMLGGVIYEE